MGHITNLTTKHALHINFFKIIPYTLTINDIEVYFFNEQALRSWTRDPPPIYIRQN